MALLREYTKLERVLWFLNNSRFIRSAHVILSGEPWFISHSHHQAGARGYHIVEQPGAFLHGKIQGKPKKTKMARLNRKTEWDPVDDLSMIFLVHCGYCGDHFKSSDFGWEAIGKGRDLSVFLHSAKVANIPRIPRQTAPIYFAMPRFPFRNMCNAAHRAIV